ncbi:MAG: hypothetical protein V9H26_22890 [Verrucomicrobiota bacterium]|nr:hypothetical protein [Verrucomicrobiota bacterium]
MILLAPDCLLFRMPSGESVPFSADKISVELGGGTGGFFDQDFVEHAAASVFHYFKNHLGRETVSMAEFASAFENVLQGLGLQLDSGCVASLRTRQAANDLRLLAQEAGAGCELMFFPRLRASVREQAHASPQLIRFHGLRACVKRLLGAQRWSPRCEQFRDQIMEFLRRSVRVEAAGDACALMVE